MKRLMHLSSLLFFMLVLLSLTGCSGSLRKPIVLIDEEIQVEEDQYRYYQIELTKIREISIDYRVKSGDVLEVYFMDSDNFDNFKKMVSAEEDVTAEYYTDLSSFGTTQSTKSATIEEGIYYLVFENTDFGKVYPPLNFKNDISTLDVYVTKK